MITVTYILFLESCRTSHRECLNALTNQTGSDMEIICLYHNSDSPCRAVIEEYEKTDSRIQAIGGDFESSGEARNAGIEAASGQYLYFGDAGSIFSPNACSIIAEQLYSTHCDLLCFSYDSADMESQLPLPGESYSVPKQNLNSWHPEFVKLLHPSAFLSNKLFRTRFILNHFIRFDHIPYSDSRWFVYRAMLSAHSVSIIEKPLLCYKVPRIRPFSTTGEYQTCFDCSLLTNTAILRISSRNTSVKEHVQAAAFQDVFSVYNDMTPNTTQSIHLKMQGFLLDHMTEFEECRLLLNPFILSQGEMLLNSRFDDRFPNTVPIVISSDRYDLPYTAAAIASVIANSSIHSYYKIYILHTDLKEEDEVQLKIMERENIRISLYPMSPIPDPSWSHITEMHELSQNEHMDQALLGLYRLSHFLTIMQFHEKVIYLDCNMLVRSDLAELKAIDLTGYVAGAVRQVNEDPVPDSCTCTMIPDPGYYFLTGILLIHVNKFNELHLAEKTTALLEGIVNGHASAQDILNILCYKSFLFLPDKWRQNSAAAPYSDLFWQYALLTPYYEELKQRMYAKQHAEAEASRQAEKEAKRIEEELSLLSAEVDQLQNRKDQLISELSEATYSVECLQASFTFRCAHIISSIAQLWKGHKKDNKKGDSQ